MDADRHREIELYPHVAHLRRNIEEVRPTFEGDPVVAVYRAAQLYIDAGTIKRTL